MITSFNAHMNFMSNRQKHLNLELIYKPILTYSETLKGKFEVMIMTWSKNKT